MKKSLLHYIKKFVFLFIIICINNGQLFAGDPILFNEQIEVINFYKADKAIFSSPISTYNDDVIVGSHDKNIYFFDKKGNLKKTYETNGWVHASPSILTDSSIAIGSYDGYIYFFDSEGRFQNKIKPGSGSVFTSIIELPNRLLVFGSNKKGRGFS